MYQHILVTLPCLKFHENPFSRSRVVLCGQIDRQTDTHMAMRIGIFLQVLVANTPTNDSVMYFNFYIRVGKAKEFELNLGFFAIFLF
jgi:hypothetical protein